MDNKFQRPNKAALTNAQYFSFMTAFQEQLQSAVLTECLTLCEVHNSHAAFVHSQLTANDLFKSL